ncbi:MAG TPA: DUF2934 domain-containing protein [Candidatus Sulfotelmatobacter sp.]|nr:DUF2934 domain-containing protein [Candidatus Sulfotelmatobacter sp.]
MKNTRMKLVVNSVDKEDEIRQRAFELFEARGGQEGRELEDWLQAEEEIRSNRTNMEEAA